MDEETLEGVDGVKDENESEDMGTETEESDSDSEKEEDVLHTPAQSQGDEIVYDDLELLPSSKLITKEELESDDLELWLVRIPGHDTLMDSVVGSTVSVTNENSTSNRSQRDKPKTDGYGKKCNRFTGSYYFRDHGPAGLDNLRAFAVVKDDGGEPSLAPAKPFARSVTVTFDCMLTNMNTTPQEERAYPEKPSGLKLQYVAVGSKRVTPALPSLPKPVSRLPSQNIETPSDVGPLNHAPREQQRKRRRTEPPSMGFLNFD